MSDERESGYQGFNDEGTLVPRRSRLARHLPGGVRESRGGDFIGRSEFYVGVSIKPRNVDFDLFHQSPEAENCYGPFRARTLTDQLSCTPANATSENAPT